MHPSPLPTNLRSVPGEGTGDVAESPSSLQLSPPSPWENRRLCQLVLEKGIDAMPEPDRTPAGPLLAPAAARHLSRSVGSIFQRTFELTEGKKPCSEIM